MNVSTTTLPRRSASESRRSSCAVSVNAGAGPIVGSASDFGAASTEPPTQLATAASKTASRITLTLQLLLQLVEEPPVGALGDQLLRARLDHARLVQAERVEADRVLGAVLAPPAVGDVLHGLQRVLVRVGEPPVDHGAGRHLRLERADPVRLEEGADRPLGGDGVA